MNSPLLLCALRTGILKSFTSTNLQQQLPIMCFQAVQPLGTLQHGHVMPQRVHRFCRDEEKAFVKTLNSGRARFEKLADATIAAGGKMLAGKDAFLLWDTFGYPLDLTQVYPDPHPTPCLQTYPAARFLAMGRFLLG